jgi:hypothetical protein
MRNSTVSYTIKDNCYFELSKYTLPLLHDPPPPAHMETWKWSYIYNFAIVCMPRCLEIHIRSSTEYTPSGNGHFLEYIQS